MSNELDVEDGETWYDAEIAPALEALAKRCNERGMAFVAEVEYKQNCHSGTYFLGNRAGLSMQMLNLCARTLPNVDRYVINLSRYCKDHGIDTTGSFVMQNLGGKT